MKHRKKKLMGSKVCHGCDGRGWIAVTEPAHWEAGGGPDLKVKRLWLPTQTKPAKCIICEGEGLIIDEDGSVTIREAGQATKVLKL